MKEVAGKEGLLFSRQWVGMGVDDKAILRNKNHRVFRRFIHKPDQFTLEIETDLKVGATQR